MKPYAERHVKVYADTPIPYLLVPRRTDTEGREESVRYEIRIEGLLDERRSSWFDGLQLTSEPGDVTVIAGPVANQAALHGPARKGP